MDPFTAIIGGIGAGLNFLDDLIITGGEQQEMDLKRDTLIAQRENLIFQREQLEAQQNAKRLELLQNRENSKNTLVIVGVIAVAGVAGVALWRGSK